MVAVSERDFVSGSRHFEDKEAFLSAFEPLLSRFTEYHCTGVMGRAVGFFNPYASIDVAEKMAREGIPGAQELYDTQRQELIKLQQKHPTEWEAWEFHKTYSDVLFSGIGLGLVTIKDLKELRQNAEREYRDAHK